MVGGDNCDKRGCNLGLSAPILEVAQVASVLGVVIREDLLVGMLLFLAHNYGILNKENTPR